MNHHTSKNSGASRGKILVEESVASFRTLRVGEEQIAKMSIKEKLLDIEKMSRESS